MKALWDSTAALFRRFGIQPTVDGQGRKLMEEVYELVTALHDDDTVPHEAADVLVVVMSLLQASGYDYADFEAAVQRVIIKNDSKTPLTHYVDGDNRIARRVR